MVAGIPTYLSHSYRREDQEINLKFWPIFENAGFYFSVDPPSNITTTAHLEQMMNASSCYVAIVCCASSSARPYAADWCVEVTNVFKCVAESRARA